MKYSEFKHFGGSCGIYLITNLINHHMYVGQTSRAFTARWKEHFYSSTCNSGNEFHTPLHLAINKYGIDNFDFQVLEECPIDQLDEREQYWINYYQTNNHDNYNATRGGQNANLKKSINLIVRPIIEELQHSTLTIAEIAQKYNVSGQYVSSINVGARNMIDGVKYPIRDKNFYYQAIADEILHSTDSLSTIAKRMNISISKIKRINKGENGYCLLGYNYPLRPKILKDSDKVKDLLQHSQLSMLEIAAECEVSDSTVYKINKGQRSFDPTLTYPLRK